ncbi:hypothetical protein ABH924_001789 [Arthrobacter sp. GAS37]
MLSLDWIPEVEVIPMVMLDGRNTPVVPSSISYYGVHLLTPGAPWNGRRNDRWSLGLWQEKPTVRSSLLSKLKTGQSRPLLSDIALEL